MEAFLDNSTVKVDNLDVIGVGGEGFVVKYSEEIAIKIYHTPTHERSEKLKNFLSGNWVLPQDRVAIPLQPVFRKDKSLIIGLTMPYLGIGFEDVGSLSNKQKRASLGLSVKEVGQIFLDGHQTLSKIHSAQLVVGDLSDQNTLFRSNKMLWIDVDAWQFGKFPCPVATEEFIDPSLYGVELSLNPVFTPEHDWYSYAVLLFRSLTLTHPYGGVHKTVRTLMKRAEQKITVFDREVRYPKMAIHPDILSDDLAHEFMEFFKNGVRKKFNKNVLLDYLENLTLCPNCKSWCPNSRKGCPVCNQRTIVVITRPDVTSDDFGAKQLFRTDGEIIYSKIIGENIFVITHEDKNVFLNKISKEGNIKKLIIGDFTVGARYAISDDLLVLNHPKSENLSIYDLSNENLQAFHRTVSEIFTPNRKAMFQVSGNKLIRIVSGNIMAGESRGGVYVERHVRNGIPKQTWFSVNSTYSGLQMFGFFQVLASMRYWYHLDGKNFEPPISELSKGETLLDISVKFSRDEVVLRRKTQEKGVDYLLVDLIDHSGQVTFSDRIKYEDHPANGMHGQAFYRGTLLHASDDGVVQEKVAKKEFRTFMQTEPFISAGDVLHQINQGIVIINLNTVTFLQIK